MIGEILWNEKTIAVAGAFAVPIAAIVGSFWYKWNKARADHQLKQSMINRGMSVEEMERVLAMEQRKH